MLAPDAHTQPALTEHHHAITAPDGWQLDVLEVNRGANGPIVIAGHAMMADRRTLWRPDRPCLVRSLAESDLRILVPDLRGHGKSGPVASEGGDWSYEDLVEDTALYIALARELAPDKACFLLGHSLFGHTSLAWLGQHPGAPVAGLIALAPNVWARQFEDKRTAWWTKRALVALSTCLVHAVGYLPARAFRQGSNDEASSYWKSFGTWMRLNRWVARTGEDYGAGLRDIRSPILVVASHADRIFCPPRNALALTRDVTGPRDVIVLPATDGAGPMKHLAPDHMQLVTSAESAPLWTTIAEWIVGYKARGDR